MLTTTNPATETQTISVSSPSGRHVVSFLTSRGSGRASVIENGRASARDVESARVYLAALVRLGWKVAG